MPEQELVDEVTGIVDCPVMATVTETEFNKLRDRVRVLENQRPDVPNTWVERHPTLAWAIALVAPTLIGVLAIVFGLLPHIENDATIRISNSVQDGLKDGLKDPVKRIDDLSQTVAEMKGELEYVLPDIRDQVKKQIKDSLILPTSKFEQSLPRLGLALRIAKNSNVQLEPSTMQALGQKLSQVVSKSPDHSQQAWAALTGLVDNRSSYNAQVDPEYESYHQTLAKPTEPPVRIPGIYDYRSNGIIVGATVVLDGISWDGVVFKNATIRYNGGLVALHHVRFENCRFEIPTISTPAHDLSQKLLASEIVDFTHHA